MNPELVRNVWIELTPRRVGFTLVILTLLFLALLATSNEAVSGVAMALFYLLAVGWGTHSAALAVVGEIRNRTWDQQCLSAIGPAAMTWGKLFGSTIYPWFAGGVCLAVMILAIRPVGAMADMAVAAAHGILVAVIGQSAALLTSLLAAARREQHTRLEVYLYQTAGLAAATAAWGMQLAVALPARLAGYDASVVVRWWGVSVGTNGFLFLSLLAFTVWLLVACHRAMRLELRMQNGPWVWVAWLVFVATYVAGFEPSPGTDLAATSEIGRRLRLALGTYVGLTYAMVLLEPKERVLYRWLGAELQAGRLASALERAQGWMMSYGASLAVGAVLVLWSSVGHGVSSEEQLAIVALLGFLTRDAGIVVLMHTRQGRRSDLAALVTLGTLYLLLPVIVRWSGVEAAFLPVGTWLSAGCAWAEAMVVVIAAARRVGLEGGSVSRDVS